MASQKELLNFNFNHKKREQYSICGNTFISPLERFIIEKKYAKITRLIKKNSLDDLALNKALNTAVKMNDPKVFCIFCKYCTLSLRNVLSTEVFSPDFFDEYLKSETKLQKNGNIKFEVVDEDLSQEVYLALLLSKNQEHTLSLLFKHYPETAYEAILFSQSKKEFMHFLKMAQENHHINNLVFNKSENKNKHIYISMIRNHQQKIIKKELNNKSVMENIEDFIEKNTWGVSILNTRFGLNYFVKKLDFLKVIINSKKSIENVLMYQIIKQNNYDLYKIIREAGIDSKMQFSIYPIPAVVQMIHQMEDDTLTKRAFWMNNKYEKECLKKEIHFTNKKAPKRVL